MRNSILLIRPFSDDSILTFQPTKQARIFCFEQLWQTHPMRLRVACRFCVQSGFLRREKVASPYSRDLSEAPMRAGRK
jgi:hypothetical protein